MASLDIDFEVYKALTSLRESESDSYNDVLRRLLKLGATAPPAAANQDGQGWTCKGVTLPNGTELRALYQGRTWLAKIENSRWVQDGEIYNSPSAASMAITKHASNGWWFWSVKRPGDGSWFQLNLLRKTAA